MPRAGWGRAINRAVLNPVFLGDYVGTVLVCVALCGTVVVTGGPGTAVVAAGVYLVGVIGVTGVVNVAGAGALALLLVA